ncbi:DUF6778 family protein [Pontitalea aquivivens]|uniref:DUF6778 family protein n=1 Tax=Pontitalea aquivivens TaxID=3388663 RepID=UPI00397048CD
MSGNFSRRAVIGLGLGALAVLAGCGSAWMTSYEPVGASAKDWRLAGVDVTVPETLSVSEDNTVYVPKADIVWQGEPFGDRRAQVARLLREGITHGAAGLNGKQRVRFRVTLQTFHALNEKSRRSAPAGTGVYDIRYTIEVVDARNGAVIVPAQAVAADFPGQTGTAATQMEARGITQRVQVVGHLAATTAGWLGLGPDNRTSFARIGG